MRHRGILCIIAAIAATIPAIATIQARAREQPGDDLFGYSVGAFLIPVALLIVGLKWMRDDAKR